MPGKTFTFGTFALTPANGIYVSEVQEMSPGKRNLTILAQAGYRGDKVLRSIDGSKMVRLKGTIYKETEAEFIAAVRAFNQAMMNELSSNLPTAALSIQNSLETYIYEDTIVMGTDAMIPPEQPYNINWIPFEVTFFIPKGFARSLTQTQVNFNDVTTTPLSSSITIDSEATPEPVITLTFTTHTTITSFTFLNTTTNESISCSGLTIVDGDVITINTATKTVMQNTTPIRYSGVMPTFIVGLNNFTLSFSGTNATLAEQLSYDGARNVYGANWLAQKFQIGGSPASVSQIALLLKKVSGQVYQLLDNFDDNSLNTSIWVNRTGTYAEEGGKLRVGKKSGSGNDGNVNTGGRSGVSGFEIAFDWEASGSEGPDVYAYVESAGSGATGGTVEARSQHAVGKTIIQGTGALSSLGSYELLASSGTVRVEQDGALINVYVNDILRLSGTFNIGAAPVVGLVSEGGSGSNFYIQASIINEKVTATENGTITVTIETDSTGEPSGTPVTNGTLTIPASEVGTDAFSELIKAFASSLSLSATTDYHLVIKQSGGDINNYYQAKVFSAGAYASGNSETTADSGGAWTQVTAEDLYFKVYGTLPTGFTVGLDIDYYPTRYSVV